MTNSRVNFCFVFNVQTFALFSELLNRYCNSSREEKAVERTCSPQGSYIPLAAGAFYKMFSYKQFNFATGTSASLYLNSFVSFHGKTGVCPLAESVEEHENVFQKAGSCDSDSSRAFNNNLLYYSDFLLLSLNLLKHIASGVRRRVALPWLAT